MKPQVNPSKKENILLRMHPLQRLLLSLVLSGLVFLLVPKERVSVLFLVMIVWIAFAFTFNLTGWIILFTRPVAQIKKVAKADDGSKAFVFVMILAASFASMFTVLLLMLSHKREAQHPLFVPVIVVGMVLSWVMVHTLFTSHYAHMYYDDADEEGKDDAEGLDFPGETRPDYIDFAYLSFVIGCTFQVSDVQVKARHIRRTVLLHGLISFVLNTFVVALTINLIASLNQ